VSQQPADRAAVNIVRPFSSRVIEIKALRRQPEVPEPAARAAVDKLEVKVQEVVNLDQVSGVQRQAIHHSHQPGQVLLQVVHQRQEAMAVVAVKAAVQADQAVDYNKIKNGVV
jgi:hypothetical protein